MERVTSRALTIKESKLRAALWETPNFRKQMKRASDGKGGMGNYLEVIEAILRYVVVLCGLVLLVLLRLSVHLPRAPIISC